MKKTAQGEKIFSAVFYMFFENHVKAVWKLQNNDFPAKKKLWITGTESVHLGNEAQQ